MCIRDSYKGYYGVRPAFYLNTENYTVSSGTGPVSYTHLDNQLLSEWDYEQNKLKPTEVSRTSAKRAWWKCRHGHSWSMKINERTILNKGCRICG